MDIMEEAAQVLENQTAINSENVDAVVQEMAQNNAQRNPEDIAAEFFQQNYPKYRGIMITLGKKDLLRVNEALIGYPLEIVEPKFNDKRAHLAFAMGVRLIEAKQIMINFVQLEQMKELAAKSGEAGASPVNNENAVTEQGENNNG